MVTPTPYTRARDYAAFQADNPDTPFNGSDLNADLDGVKTATDSLTTCLATIRKDDGTLANQSIGVDQLKTEIISLLNGVSPKGDWVTATAYKVGDLVNHSGGTYLAIVAHTAGTFSTDLSAGKWMTMSALEAAASVSFTPAGNIAATNVQDALTELDSEKQPLATLLTAIAGLTMAADKLIYGTGAGSVATSALTSFARGLLAKTDGTAVCSWIGGLNVAGDSMLGPLFLSRSPIDPVEAATKGYVDSAVSGVGATVPAGTLVPFSGFVLPPGYLWANGVAVGRETYPALYAATNTTATITMTIASPCVVSWTGHGLKDNWPVKFKTTGALPTGLTAGTTYYVKSSTADTFQLSATPGGSAINTSGSQSGTHTGVFSPHGDGDGSTTFNVIDMRDRTAFGLDDMFTGSSGRITSGTPKTIGASLGAETVTLAAGNIPALTGNVPANDGLGGGGTVGVNTPTTGSPLSSIGVSVGSGSPTAVNKLPPGIHVPWIVKT